MATESAHNEGKRRPNPKRSGRSLQRQRALDVLFEADSKELHADEIPGLLDERASVSTSQKPIGEFGIQIVRTYADNAENVDSLIEASSPEWSIDRMSLVDRNLLRIGFTELMYMGTDRPVVIKEISSLVRDLSTDQAVPFTMGVLNRGAEIWELETSGREED